MTSDEPKRNPWKKPLIIVGVVFGLFLLMGLIGALVDETDESRSAAAPKSTPKVLRKVESWVVSSIEEYTGVRDAAVSQDGRQVSLVLVVGYATSQTYAKDLGDAFVRLAKTSLKDGSPGRTIGKGDYDYVIGVYFPNQKKLVQGAKSRGSDRISW